MTDDAGLPAAPPRDDYESGVGSAERMELRIWLRLLTCCNLIEGEVRQNLSQGYDTTLPRFDILAQLQRAGGPLSMGELSRRLMVSNGNVTGLVDRLVREGMVERRAAPTDRRVQMVDLTRAGRRFFDDMAAEHNLWVSEMMDGLTRAEMSALLALLAKLKQSVLATKEAAEMEE